MVFVTRSFLCEPVYSQNRTQPNIATHIFVCMGLGMCMHH